MDTSLESPELPLSFPKRRVVFPEKKGRLERRLLLAVTVVAFLLCASAALAHGVGSRDAAFLNQNSGLAFMPYVYLGAKHMTTGYDHLLFLAGVIFFLYRVKDVALYVTLFAVGHSITLLTGVLGGIHCNAHLIDAIIGLSVAYKGFENLGGFRALGMAPNTRVAVLVFGLFHGFGLATKLQEVALSQEGLVGNLVGFNLGVELGQFGSLALIVVAFNVWRSSGTFMRSAYVANSILMTAGFVLVGYQLTGYWVS